jgi:mycoredoxin
MLPQAVAAKSQLAGKTEDDVMVTMYTTTWCGYCVRLKAGLQREGIDYTEVNIETDESAADLVMQVNGGNRTVPTLVFPDGTALTNPSIAEVKAQLAA